MIIIPMSKNIRFTENSEDRVTQWSESDFDMQNTRDLVINRISPLEIEFNAKIDNTRWDTSLKYIKVDSTDFSVSSIHEYYFVNSAVYMNDDTIKYSCSLDVIASFWPRIGAGAHANVIRRSIGKTIYGNWDRDLNFISLPDPDISLPAKNNTIVNTFEPDDRAWYDKYKKDAVNPAFYRDNAPEFLYAIVIPSESDIKFSLKKDISLGRINGEIYLAPIFLTKDDVTDITVNKVSFSEGNLLIRNRELQKSNKIKSIISTKWPLISEYDFKEDNFAEIKLVSNNDSKSNTLKFLKISRSVWGESVFSTKDIFHTSSTQYPTHYNTDMWRAEPALRSPNITELHLRKLGTGESVKIPSQLLISNYVSIEMRYIINPGSSKVVIRLINTTLDNDNSNDEMYYTFSKISEIPILNDNYLNFINGSMLAYNQGIDSSSTKEALGISNSVVSGIGSMAEGHIVSGLFSSIMGGVTSGINQSLTRKMYTAKLGDLKNSPLDYTSTPMGMPSTFKENFNKSICEVDLVQKTYFDSELRTIANFYNRYGYHTNEVLNLGGSKLLHNIPRNSFVYVKISDISYSMFTGEINRDAYRFNAEVIDKINETFAKGVRLWGVMDTDKNIDMNTPARTDIQVSYD